MNTNLIDGLFRLDGKVAVVPGGYGGIGEAVCRGLSQAGAKVVIAGRSLEKSQALAQQICVEGGTAFGLGFDALSVAEVRSTVDAAAQHFGRIDILVNCVGLNREEKAIDVTEDNFDLVIGANVKSALFLAQAAAKHMIARGEGGKQIHLGSVRTMLALRGRGYAAYTAAKGGLGVMFDDLLAALYTLVVIAIAKHVVG